MDDAAHFDTAVVQAALDRLLSTPLFAVAKRSSQLLRYLVTEVLEGRGNAVSEYAIALDVFDRSETFDHRTDTCVRTEAWRLRGRLQRHYQGEGHNDPVRFIFPPRSFVPSVEIASKTATPAEPRTIRLAISVECDATARDDEQLFARRLPEELANSLLALSGVTPLIGDFAGEADLQLRCGVRSEANWTRIIATLIDSDHQVRGAKAFSCPRGVQLRSPRSVADGVRIMVRERAGNPEPPAIPGMEAGGGRIGILDQLLRASPVNRGARLAELRKDVLRLEGAIADDPRDRLAYSRLIGTLGQFLSLAPSATPSVMPKLAACAGAALALDEGLDDVWLTLAWASSYAHDWAQTEKACRRAMAIAPLDPSGYILLTLTYLQQGLLDRAIELAEAAMALDPFSPMVANAYALTLNGARRFKEASEVAAYALEAEPGFVKLRLTYAETMLHLGQIDRATEEFEIAHAMVPQDLAACSLLGFAYGLAGNRAGATDMLAKLRSPELRGQTIYAEAIVSIGLGAHEEAIAALSRAVHRRGTPGLILANATFDSIRADDRFVRIERLMEKGCPVGLSGRVIEQLTAAGCG